MADDWQFESNPYAPPGDLARQCANHWSDGCPACGCRDFSFWTMPLARLECPQCGAKLTIEKPGWARFSDYLLAQPVAALLLLAASGVFWSPILLGSAVAMSLSLGVWIDHSSVHLRQTEPQ